MFRPRALFFVIVGSIAFLPAVGTAAVMDRFGEPAGVLSGAALFCALLAPAARMRCAVGQDGLVAVNYFRSHHVRWSDVASLAVMPSPFPFGTDMTSTPECRTTSGRRFWVMALWEAPVKQADLFQRLIDEKAAEHGFDARAAWGYARG